MTGISDKIILISGASGGIGEATVRELAAAGARLFIGARRGERLKALADELREQVGWQKLEVSDGASFDAFADAAEARFGRIDVLINNAGVMPLSPLAALKPDKWKKMIDVNVHGVLNGIAAVLPRFPGAARRPCRQRRLGRRVSRPAGGCGLLRHEIGGVGDHRGLPAGA